MPSVRIGRQEIVYREAGVGRAPNRGESVGPRRSESVGGPPILLLHGAGGSSQNWAATIAQLGGRRRCVAPDLPGHGRSPAFEPPPPPSELCERYRDLVAELGERLGLGRFILCGHSLGGAVALQLALAFPDRLERLVLVTTAARLPVEDELYAAILCDREAELPERFAATGYSPTSPRAQRERWAREQIQARREVVLADFRACDTLDLRDRLQAIAVPTTVICAADDRITPPTEQERLAAAIHGARLERVERAGHFVLFERPDALADRILSSGRLASSAEV